VYSIPTLPFNPKLKLQFLQYDDDAYVLLSTSTPQSTVDKDAGSILQHLPKTKD
jgi:hypothetical protein